MELEESDGDKVKYPKENARLKNGEIDWTKLMTYQSLKLSDKAIISELAKTNAPLIVGEPLETNNQENSNTRDCCLIDEEFFLANYEKEFPTKNSKGQVISLPESVKNSLRRIFKSISEYYSNEKRCCNKYHIAYLLATSKHETGHTFDPVEEAHWLSWNVRKKYFEDMYDPVLGKNEKRRKMAKDNGNTQQGDGVKYYGRDYVQLTWKDNYQRMKDKFHVDFVNNREKALEHEWAIKILIYGSEQGVFTGLKLSRYINESKQDYYHARQVINGLDKATTIEGYAKKNEKCLKIEKCNCGNNLKNSTNTQKDGYDIEKAVSKLNANALSGSKGECAKYVRWAVEAGGLSTTGRPVSAKDYDKFLPKLGFSETSKEGYNPVKGDIVVIESISGHPHGHIAMYNGEQWISDFKQRDIWAGSAYRNAKPNYRIFRW